jgi:hypothetical protein
VVAGPADQGLEPTLDVGLLEELALLLVGEVWRPAGRVCDQARVGHLVDLVDDLPGLTALEHGDDEPLVLLGELAGVVAHRLLHGLDLHPQGRARSGDAAADPRAAAGAQHGARASAHQPADPLDRGHDAVRRVTVLETRGEQQLTVRAGTGGVDGGLGGLVERDRDDHAGQDHEVRKEQHR